jgi:hypothetical protein
VTATPAPGESRGGMIDTELGGLVTKTSQVLAMAEEGSLGVPVSGVTAELRGDGAGGTR